MKVRVCCRVPRREGRQKLSRDAVLPALNLCLEGCPVDAVSGLDLLSKICAQCCAGDVREDFCLVAVYVGFSSSGRVSRLGFDETGLGRKLVVEAEVSPYVSE
jgi:hypothetical protein